MAESTLESKTATAETFALLSSETLPDLISAINESRSRTDLELVARHHAAETGCDNPNSAQGAFLFSTGDITTQEGCSYRQVGPEAIADLIESGIVRNAATAQGEKSHRWGHTVFWHQGIEGKAINLSGRFVLVAPQGATTDGWVTIDKLAAIYGLTAQGEIVNLLALEQSV